MRERFCIVAVLTTALLPTEQSLAQEVSRVGPPPGIVTEGVDLEEEEARRRANAAGICWRRAGPQAVEWMAERDPGYRRDVLDRYHFAQTGDGWSWVRRDAVRGNNVRATQAGAVEGIPYTSLSVHASAESDAWAQFTIESALTTGQARFEWIAPPERICMADGLRLQASAEVVGGDPGNQRIFYVLPLTEAQVSESSDDVKACSPATMTQVDAAAGISVDTGRCHRELFHLDSAAPLTILLSLPESFYVVYSYDPDDGKSR